MNITGNTILITGGTSGIGFELASQFAALDNTVIITGRNPIKIELAKKRLPVAHLLQSDVANPDSIKTLYEKINNEFPNLNMVINNAGIMYEANFNNAGVDLEEKITEEIEINLKGPIRMVEQFLPLLKNQKQAAIVNVSSALAFVPLPISPVYCATKAGLHSFTQSLRIQLRNTNIKVFELAPPLTNTDSVRTARTEDELRKLKPMDVRILVKHTLEGIKYDRYEICPGQSNTLKVMNRLAPDFILKQLSKSIGFD